jgi:acetyl esterase
MQLDPEIGARLQALRSAGLPKFGSLPVADLRALSVAAPPSEAVWSVRDVAIPGPAGEVPARIYQPAAATDGVIVYYHGGGWTIGSLDSHDAWPRLCANLTGCTIVSVDYRLAPEHPFPAAVEDSWAALLWAARERQLLTGSASAPLIVMGDSAGGNLAAVVAILARDAGGPEIALQVLIYPATEGDVHGKSMYRFEAPFMERNELEWFYNQYIPLAERGDFRFAPGRAPDLSRLPRAVILTADLDLLAEEGGLYAEKLQAAGNQALHLSYKGAVHGFFMFAGTELSRRAQSDVIREVRGVTLGATKTG